jgi:hypothetical protein
VAEAAAKAVEDEGVDSSPQTWDQASCLQALACELASLIDLASKQRYIK